MPASASIPKPVPHELEELNAEPDRYLGVPPTPLNLKVIEGGEAEKGGDN